MPFFNRSLAGPGYVVLNVIRVVNIITLTACVAASFAMLVKTFNISKFFFFDGVTHVITGFLSMALILTEIPLFKRYTAANWPLLSPKHGFVTLGMLMLFLGVFILANLNKTATSQNSLGSHYWSLVIAAGILISITGVINIFANYMFRQKKMGITARQVRAHGITAPQKCETYVSPSVSTRSARPKTFGFGKRSVSEGLPRYETRPQSRNISAPLPTGGSFEKFEGERSPEMGVQRPASVHPAFRGAQQQQGNYI